MSDTSIQQESAPIRRWILRYWPIVLGVTAATFQVATGIATEAVAVTVSLAACCYLVGAVFGRPWSAWATIPGGTMVVVLCEVTGARWWIGLAVCAAAVLVIGFFRRAPIPVLTAQGLALVGFGGAAVIAVLVSPRVGLFLAGIALAAHALWDYRHWRRNEVVPRSFTEFCMVLDIPLGVVAVLLAVVG